MRIEMKKIAVFFLVVAVFVFFQFSFVIFAQDESKKPDNSNAEQQERGDALNAEKEAISALKNEFTKRIADYDTKCKGKSFDLNKENEKQIANECQKESEWLISSQKSLKERQQKYKENLAQLKLYIYALQKAKATAELQERANALNQDRKDINALKTEYRNRLEEFNNVKCSREALTSLSGEQKEQKRNECDKEREELMGIRGKIAKRETKYSAEYKQFMSDLNAAKGNKNAE
jgi:hypothetical protein